MKVRTIPRKIFSRRSNMFTDLLVGKRMSERSQSTSSREMKRSARQVQQAQNDRGEQRGVKHRGEEIGDRQTRAADPPVDHDDGRGKQPADQRQREMRQRM